MSPVKRQLLLMIDYLPEQEQALLLEIAKRFISDDTATNDDLEAISEARGEYARGETSDHAAIDWR